MREVYVYAIREGNVRCAEAKVKCADQRKLHKIKLIRKKLTSVTNRESIPKNETRIENY